MDFHDISYALLWGFIKMTTIADTLFEDMRAFQRSEVTVRKIRHFGDSSMANTPELLRYAYIS
jgi:hypothetical protein